MKNKSEANEVNRLLHFYGRGYPLGITPVGISMPITLVTWLVLKIILTNLLFSQGLHRVTANHSPCGHDYRQDNNNH